MIRVVVNIAARLLVKLLARVRVLGSGRIPTSGPLIVVTNHINFFEAPLIYLLLIHLRPRALTKEETWDQPLLKLLANLWGAIPVKRGGVNTRAFGRAYRFLASGGVLVVAPEGTRSRDGRLRKANAGVVVLAARSRVPILPIAHWGGERVVPHLRKLRRPIVRVRFGEELLVSESAAETRESRTAEIDRIMCSLAAMLPPEYRGHYA